MLILFLAALLDNPIPKCIGEYSLNLNSYIHLEKLKCSNLKGKVLPAGETTWNSHLLPVIRIRANDGQFYSEIKLSKNGKFVIDNLKPGEYCFEIGLDGWIGFEGWLIVDKACKTLDKDFELAPD